MLQHKPNSVALPSACLDRDRVEVSLIQRGQETDWDEFVLRCPQATHFHQYAWKSIVEKVLHRTCYYLAARKGNTITGILPLSLATSKLFGNSLVSLPLTVYGGICADDEQSYSTLLKAGSEIATQLGVKYLELRNRSEPFPIDLPGRELYVSFTEDLKPGPDKLLQALPRDTRYMIRKSLKAGLTWADDLTLNEFYELYARNVHRLGTPVFPKVLFHQLASQFGSQSKLFAVRRGKTAIAGVFCFYFKNEVIPYYSGWLPEFQSVNPNNFMYWSLMSQSSREGYERFDFGRSKIGTGACLFKMSWGMQMNVLPYRYQLVCGKEVPKMSPIDKKFQLPVAVWKRLPLGVTKVLGPALVRAIPSI